MPLERAARVVPNNDLLVPDQRLSTDARLQTRGVDILAISHGRPGHYDHYKGEHVPPVFFPNSCKKFYFGLCSPIPIYTHILSISVPSSPVSNRTTFVGMKLAKD